MTKSSLCHFSPISHAQVRGTTELYEKTVGCDLWEPGTPSCYCKVHCSWFVSVTFAIEIVPLQAEVTYLIMMSCAYTGTGWVFLFLHPRYYQDSCCLKHLQSLCSNECGALGIWLTAYCVCFQLLPPIMRNLTNISLLFMWVNLLYTLFCPPTKLTQ